MAQFTLPQPHPCPKCNTNIDAAERKDEYAPVVVIVCPACGEMLWLPGAAGAETHLFPFDPSADSEGI